MGVVFFELIEDLNKKRLLSITYLVFNIFLLKILNHLAYFIFFAGEAGGDRK